VQIVQHRDQTEGTYSQIILSGFAIDGRVRFISGPFEQNFALIPIHVDIGEGSPCAVCTAKIVYDFVFRDGARVGSIYPVFIESAMKDSRPLVGIKPLGMIQREARDREKKEDRETEHRQIGVQPAREMRETPFPMQMTSVME